MNMDIGSLPFIEEIEGLDAPPRMSQEINPQNLADLFANDLGCDANNNNHTTRAEAPLSQQVSRATAFAGSGIDDEFEMKKLQVFVRIRPTATNNTAVNASTASTSTSHWDAENCIHAAAKHTLAIAPPEGSMAYKAGDRGQTFTFSQVFDAATSQEQYFSSTAAPMVDDLLRNPQHNSVMMAYGITAAGKTYTIEGTKTAPGVLPRALTAVFDGIANHMDAESLAVRVSYCEIYNEAVYDLIEEAHNGWGVQKRPALRLMEDARGRVRVAGLSEVEVKTAEEALGVLRRGAKHRQRAETGLNFSSSRSHSIFGINLVRKQDMVAEKDGQGGEEGVAAATTTSAAALKAVKVERLGRMSFVDLAGSERAQRTGNVGIRLKESVAINSSLMTLGRCLEALRWNQQQQALSQRHATGNANDAPAAGPLKVVPYRESKVTHLFRDVLHGYGRVVLSVNVSPCAKDYDETAHVLRYASLATAIGTLQQAEAPRRTIKAVTPGALRRAKRKAAAKVAKDEAAKKARKKVEQQQQQSVEEEAKVDAAEPTPSVVADEDTLDPSTTANRNVEVAAAVATGGAAAVTAPTVPPSSSAPVAEGEEEVVYEVMGRRLLSDEFDNVAATIDTNNNGTPAAARPSPFGEENQEEAMEQLQEVNDEYEIASPKSYCFDDDDDDDDDDDQGANTPSTPCSDDCEILGEDETVVALQAQVQQLLQDLQAAEERAVLLEGEVREEVAGEMAGLLKDMEESYRERLTAEVAAAEARAAKTAANGKNKAGGRKKGGRGMKSNENDGENHEPSAAAGASTEELEEATKALEKAHLEIASLRDELELHQAEAREQADRLIKAQENATAACTAAEAATAELALEKARADSFAAALADSRRSSAEMVEDDRLREQVTQLEANAAMELEMAEQQADRLRKENMSLRQQLAAAMVTLERVSSPSIPMLQRMAAACAAGGGEGNGCGPAGTPHDLALARARQAAAAEDAAAVVAEAAAQDGQAGGGLNDTSDGLLASLGRSTGHRSTGPPKSRFGEEALALAATGTQQTVAAVGFVGFVSQSENCDKTPAPVGLHNTQLEELVKEEKDLVVSEEAEEKEEAEPMVVAEDIDDEPLPDTVLVSEAIEALEMEETQQQEEEGDVEEALRVLEEAEAEAAKEVERLMALEQEQQEEKEVKEVVVVAMDAANAEEEEEEIDIINSFSPMQQDPVPATAVVDASAMVADALEETIDAVNEEVNETVEKKEVEEKEEAQKVKPKRGGRKKAAAKKESKKTKAEVEQQPVAKKTRRGRKAAAAEVVVEEAEEKEEVKPVSAVKAKGGKRGRKPKAAAVPAVVVEKEEELAAPVAAEPSPARSSLIVQGKEIAEEKIEEVQQPIVVVEDDEELLSVVKPRNATQRRNVVLLDSSSDEEEEQQQEVFAAEMEVEQKEQEEQEEEELVSESEEEEEEEDNSSDVDYNPTLEDKGDTEEEEIVEKAQKETENEPAPVEVEEEPRRQTRRASRAVSTSTSVKHEETKETKQPAPAPVAAPAGRKRRLLQVSKPLSTEMRSALGELAGADLPGSVPMARKTMSVTKKGASMAVALGLSPAPARQKSPKRSRRPLSTSSGFD